MQIIDSLFIYKNIKDLSTVVYSLKRDIPIINLYCVVYHTSLNSMELIPTFFLFSKRLQKTYGKDGLIIGVAYGKAQGMKLISHIIEDCIKNGRNILVKTEWFK